MVGVVFPCVGHIIRHVTPLEAVSVGNEEEPLQPKGPLGVDGLLTCDGQGVAQLRLSGDLDDAKHGDVLLRPLIGCERSCDLDTDCPLIGRE